MELNYEVKNIDSASREAAAKIHAEKVVAQGSSSSYPAPDPRVFDTPQAQAIKEEICAVGRKLWMRQYVDGNGGNISHRLGPNEILCTPTLASKYDMKPEDLCMVDLDGNQIAGTTKRTSEIFLHLEIYKAVPEAKSVVHCHPPHATAYAITGMVPPNLVIPEFEVFVGKVAISPYATPGTEEFAQTVIPFVKKHTTVLLTNHGIVCWADTVTHAEWCAEVLETYCWTLMLASQLDAPISYLSDEHGSDLLAMKKRLGWPDARFNSSETNEGQLADLEKAKANAQTPGIGLAGKSAHTIADADIEFIVRSVTDAVIKAIRAK